MRTKARVGKSSHPRAPWEVRYSENGKQIRKRFKNRLDAEIYADELNAELSLPNELQFDVSERIVFSQPMRFFTFL